MSGGLALLLLGCPGQQEARTEGEPTAAAKVEPPAPDPDFRRRAHAEALVGLRKEALTALRLLDPVAAAEVEGTSLHPPRFGAAARAEVREAMEAARRQAEGIRPELLSPEDGVVLRVLAHALERGRQRLTRAPWRDDPGAVVDAMAPYVRALQRRAAAGQCDDGCGLAELGPALETGLAEVGAASPAVAAAARADLAALRRELSRLPEGLPPEHALATAWPELATAFDRIDARLADAAAALPAAPELPWDQPVAPAEPAAWKRRPARWTVERLRRHLEDEESLGLPPERAFEAAELTAARLWAMLQRDAARDGAVVGATEPALPRPFDAAACEAAWAPLKAWAQAQAPELVPALDCAATVRSLPTEADDVAIVRQLVAQGIVEPTRRARVAATGLDVALVQGRAAPLAQGLTLEIAIASGSGRLAAMREALRQAHRRACVAATAVWIHGELGEPERLRPRLDASGCGDVGELVAEAEARPVAALQGLGLALLGDGPADAAALDRYFWAPMGLVQDLALPPPTVEEEPAPSVKIEELGDRETAVRRLEAVEGGGSGHADDGE